MPPLILQSVRMDEVGFRLCHSFLEKAKIIMAVIGNHCIRHVLHTFQSTSQPSDGHSGSSHLTVRSLGLEGQGTPGACGGAGAESLARKRKRPGMNNLLLLSAQVAPHVSQFMDRFTPLTWSNLHGRLFLPRDWRGNKRCRKVE